MKKKKSAYTYPKLAEYLRELFTQGKPYGWGGLDYYMEKAVQKTIEEMLMNNELAFKDNLIQLPPKKSSLSKETIKMLKCVAEKYAPPLTPKKNKGG